MKGITCVKVVTINQRPLVATACELSVRLWTIHGQFLGVFGQPSTWTHLGILLTAPLIAKKQSLVPHTPLRRRSIGVSSHGGSVIGLPSQVSGILDYSAIHLDSAPLGDKQKEHRHSIGSEPSRRFRSYNVALVERRSFTGELSLSCARPAANA